jgi:hypothetical protein
MVLEDIPGPRTIGPDDHDVAAPIVAVGVVVIVVVNDDSKAAAGIVIGVPI